MPASFLFWQYRNISVFFASCMLSCSLLFIRRLHATCSTIAKFHIYMYMWLSWKNCSGRRYLICYTAYLPISTLSSGEYLLYILYLPHCFTVVKRCCCCCCSTLITSLLAAAIALDGTDCNRLPHQLRRTFYWEEGSRVKSFSIFLLITHASMWYM